MIGTASRRRFYSFLDSELGLSDFLPSSSSSVKFVRWNAVRFDRSRFLAPIKAVKEVVSGKADGAGGMISVARSLAFFVSLCSVALSIELDLRFSIDRKFMWKSIFWHFLFVRSSLNAIISS